MGSLQIAIDAMGGDHAPAAIIEGAVQSLRSCTSEEGLCALLVGREKEISKELRRFPGLDPSRYEIVDARETISMKDHLRHYWRRKSESSISKTLQLVRDGRAAAAFSAGNSGAVMTLAREMLGSPAGVERPALALMIPTLNGQSLLVDVGATADPKARHLAQFALMGKIYLQTVHGISNPRIGLVSIGEEEAKGNELTKQAHQLLKGMDINFIGNIEGKDVFLGAADVIVTDGFTGNVALKVTEGVVEVVLSMLRREITSNLFSKIGFFFLQRSLGRIKRRLDYTETGGALLLGVNGLVMVGHGRSSARAIASAITLSRTFVRERVNERISQEMQRMGSAFKELNYA